MDCSKFGTNSIFCHFQLSRNCHYCEVLQYQIMQSVFHKLSNVLLLMCSHCINNSNCQWSWTPADRLLHCRLVLSILPFNNAKEGFGLTVHLLELKAFFVKTLWNFSHHAIILPQSSKRIMSNTKTK